MIQDILTVLFPLFFDRCSYRAISQLFNGYKVVPTEGMIS